MQPAPFPDPRAKALGWLPKIYHHQLALCHVVGILESKNVSAGWFPKGQPIQPPCFGSEYLVAQRRGMTCSSSRRGLALDPGASSSSWVTLWAKHLLLWPGELQAVPPGQVYFSRSFSAALGWSKNVCGR